MNYLKIYKTFLPCVMVPSVTISYFICLDETSSEYKPRTRMMNALGLLSLGTLIGLSYPISVPLLAVEYLYRDR